MIALKDVLLFFQDNSFPIMVGFLMERIWFVFKLFLPSIENFHITIKSDPNKVVPEGSKFQHEDIYGNKEIFITLVPTLTDDEGNSVVLVRRPSMFYLFINFIRGKFL